MSGTDVPDVNSNVARILISGKKFTDAAKYSYAALTALALKSLYGEDQVHYEFSEGLIRGIRHHLDMPQQTDHVMLALFRGEGAQSELVYVDLVRSEGKAYSFFIVNDLIYHVVRGGKYDSRTRALILRVSQFLQIRPSSLIEMMEESAVKFLLEEKPPKPDDAETLKRQRNRKIKRYALVGLATIGGGALLGLTGGLAAPLIGAGVGTVLGATAGATLGSAAGVAVIGSLFGVAGAGLSGFKMQKRVGDIEEFKFKLMRKSYSKCLHVTIAVSGWLNDQVGEAGFWIPWKNLKISDEQYCLMYESQYLVELGRSIDYLLSFAVSLAAQEALKMTVLSGLISAIAWPASLLTLASVLDNPWGVCCRRSAQIGRKLADIILSRTHGNRPVTLIGLSLGARVVFYCLLELSQRKDSEGIVLDAIMLGAPVSGRASDWSKLARVVGGNIVNGYCSGDWLLKFLYRSTTGHYRIAGLEPVTWSHPRMQNVDLSSTVSGHLDYANKIDDILLSLGYADEEEEFLGLRRRASSHGFREHSMEGSEESRKTRYEETTPSNISVSSIPTLWLNFGKLAQVLYSMTPGLNSTPTQRYRRSTKSNVNDTTSVKQFTIKDVTVPPEFLRVEYMIAYTFLGTMYGLGFLVLYQCILVPLTKGLVTIVYIWLVSLELIEPVTLEEALSQIPPT